MLLEKTDNIKVVDLLKEQELLQAKYFASDEVSFVIKYAEVNRFLESQMVEHYEECKKALRRYLEIEDMLSGIYAEYTIEVGDFRFTVATGMKILAELEVVDTDKLTGHLIISSHPMAVFLNKCYGGNMNYLAQEQLVLDPNHLLENSTIEDVMWKVEEFKIQLGYALQKFKQETIVIKGT